MLQWGVELTLDEARSLVRTFHSMILKMARSTISSSVLVLELMDMEKGGKTPDIDVENLIEGGVSWSGAGQKRLDVTKDGEAADISLQEDQEREKASERDRFLRLAYERVFANDPDFVKIVLAIYKYSLLQVKRAERDANWKLEKYVAEFDATISPVVEDAWKNHLSGGLWPMAGIDQVPGPIQLSMTLRPTFLVHGYVPAIEAYVVLGGAAHFSAGPEREEARFINSKRKLLAARSEKPIVWIDTIEELKALSAMLTWYREFEEKRSVVPMFEWKAPGDFVRKQLLRIFYEAAQFIENLGLPVAASLNEALSGKAAQALTNPEVMLAAAVARFWPIFEDVLREHDIWTFNQLFTHFSEDNPGNFENMPTYVLGAMQHLLVDEFQDISPQIVKWIRGCQRELVKRGLAGSLTCVGDDWQSIYGWRGSSPEFFVRFKEHFPAVEHGCIRLEENFRSSDHILRCAESVLANVKDMEPKTCEAMSRWANEQSPVLLYEARGDLPYDHLQQLLLAEVARTGATEREPILVLSRTGKGHEKLSKLKKPGWGKAVKFLTFHAAKGLEARSVVLLEDCAYVGVNPLKNFLYRKAGLGSFDEAQSAEARRLAYVGITRAMERCYWFARKSDGGAFGSIPLGRSFAARYGAVGAQHVGMPPAS